MGNASTLLLYTTIAIFLLLFIFFSPKQPHRPNRRLKLRSSSFDDRHRRQHSPIPFDPIIANIERHREAKEWERQYFQEHYKEFVDAAPAHESQPEWEDFMNAEDYLNDEDRFNITNRLVVLFPSLDVDPTDGFVSLNELLEWHLKTARKDVIHRSYRDMQVHDKNHDGFVSLQEYEPPAWARHSSSGWWKEDHFNASDADGDGLLNLTEFNDFLHPADTDNQRLLQWLCTEEIRERDTDKDGKLNLKEFFHGLFDSIRDYDEVSDNSSHQSNDSMEGAATLLFTDLDRDKDWYLSADELLPVIDKLHPSEHYYAKQQADYIMSQADTDKDGRLSLKEMIENPYTFYSAIFSDEEDYSYHDEFR
ncbi:uncharacterized protein LOC131218094 isoform X2 [Magnolia sinica]|uniref:uncharacterized protein LOC131218094 isoform X2 n=1 Tax=Magnolia sinica TaxID=86752 RepID=UPI002659BA5F|nr:uncharacterized protein LOC131218094 isoform X2 [Magnolia sinica]